MKKDMSQEQFTSLLPKICEKDTSSNPAQWTAGNPLWGHCAIVAILAQEIFGGEVLRQSLENVRGLEHIKSHYINKLPNGIVVDFTSDQFEHELPDNLPTEIRTREKILSYLNTEKRYSLLKLRFNQTV